MYIEYGYHNKAKKCDTVINKKSNFLNFHL